MTGIATSRTDYLLYRRDDALGLDFLRARFGGHAFDRHTHATYALGLTIEGRQCFSNRGARHTSTPGTLILLNAEDLHDGEAGDADGFAYWMLYPDAATMETVLRGAGHGDGRPLFRETLQRDPDLARVFAALFTALEERTPGSPAPRESLRAECLLDLALSGLTGRHSSGRPPTADRFTGDARLVDRIREILRENYASDIRLTDLVRETGRSRFAIHRVFHETLGVSPHRYLTMVRLERARELLTDGERPAEVAVGFVDQSHLNRRFKSAYGLTPRTFQRVRATA